MKKSMKNSVVMGFLGRFTLLLIVIFISMFMGPLSFAVSFNDSAAFFSAFFAAVPDSMSSSSSSRPGYVILICVAIMMILTWNQDRTHHLAGSLQVNQPPDDDEVYCQSATEVGKKLEEDHVSDQQFEQPPETEPGIYINEMQGRNEETVTKICSREMHESKEKEEEEVAVADELELAIPADDLRMKCEDFIAKFRENLRLQRQMLHLEF